MDAVDLEFLKFSLQNNCLIYNTKTINKIFPDSVVQLQYLTCHLIYAHDASVTGFAELVKAEAGIF